MTGVPAVCVIGLGLIGGSVLRAADAAGWQAYGATASAADAEAARSEGFDVAADVDEALRRASSDDALLVIAVPLTALDTVLRQVARFAPHCGLTDVISVKGPVAAGIEARLPEAPYVGGHPMTGSSVSGWAGGSAELFQGAPWLLVTEDDTDRAHWLRTARLALACGAEVVAASAREHDAAVARISHLPHVLAAVLASVGSGGGGLAMSLAAGSFFDGTRVAGSRPALVQAMCEGNRDELLAAIDDALGRLGVARGSLATTGSLAATINHGHLSRTQWIESKTLPTGEFQVQFLDPDAPAELRALGEAGGRVRTVHGDVLRGVLPRRD
ncbi:MULTISPECIES: prephenate dehydrogenase [Actinoalloteichus]|uniref:Prephenate dehydrogenase n=1 Tax=Actinoalloteichus fjordicus TaxID=1612552 RepID=A0AAC9L8D8_9PSEU|nr:MULTISPECIES: prephenate dehydrogenase [Actinoalloteichus]APU12264.1 prephenate dehydrogenase [Actinoalloteichus fjordicus]APU18216.1 prephenate dehydrogenase [Actinoalloteichus sp. GBA129-24]